MGNRRANRSKEAWGLSVGFGPVAPKTTTYLPTIRVTTRTINTTLTSLLRNHHVQKTSPKAANEKTTRKRTAGHPDS